ncbi:MAG TPA: outer membrane protein assembly factor BamA, partial [Sphingomicrobium sp.]|nr:outer membrane protein assembly factor BamA [Sphingomicrobium sp.]
GYAFADISPSYDRDAEKREMNLTFRVNETPRVYVERIDINGNTVTRDKVIRREFRINEGDAFNALKVKRSQDRIQSLGFFQENLEIKQTQGAGPDRVILSVDVEEKSTGELQLSAGYSSLERFILAASVAQRNFMGKGQELSAGINWSRYSRSVNLGFTEPYLFDKNVLLGGEIFRRDYNSYRTTSDSSRKNTYSQTSTGAAARLGFPINEFMSLGTRYSAIYDEISLDEDLFFSDTDGDGDEECDILLAGRYLCDQLGNTLSSVVGYSLVFDNRNGIRATRGQRAVLSQDFAGLGGDTRYVRTRLEATKYFQLPRSFILSVRGEGGYIHPLKSNPGDGVDAIRLTDRFFGPQMRGFDIRGIGPRIVRQLYETPTEVSDEVVGNDAIGGRAYYMGRVELEIPTSAGIRSLGVRPSAFIDVGSVWKITEPDLVDIPGTCTRPDDPATTGVNELDTQRLSAGQTSCTTVFGAGYAYNPRSGIKEFFQGNSISPRLSVGIGVNWQSPFGPLRIDLAKALLTQEGDETKLFSFNVGTQF